MTNATHAVERPAAAPAGPCAWPTLESVEEGARRARRVFVDARHKTEDAVAEARLTVRRHPLAAVSTAVTTGAFVGAACGFVVAWFLRGRE